MVSDDGEHLVASQVKKPGRKPLDRLGIMYHDCQRIPTGVKEGKSDIERALVFCSAGAGMGVPNDDGFFIGRLHKEIGPRRQLDTRIPTRVDPHGSGANLRAGVNNVNPALYRIGAEGEGLCPGRQDRHWASFPGRVFPLLLSQKTKDLIRAKSVLALEQDKEFRHRHKAIDGPVVRCDLGLADQSAIPRADSGDGFRGERDNFVTSPREVQSDLAGGREVAQRADGNLAKPR
jgi:hypothetical protein